MIARNLLFVVLALFVAGCETYSAPRYGISADNVVALKSLAPSRIAVGAFTEAQKFADGCRAAGPITASDGMGFAAYIRKAFVDELKIAGVYADSGTVTLTGTVDKLDRRLLGHRAHGPVVQRQVGQRRGTLRVRWRVRRSDCLQARRRCLFPGRPEHAAEADRLARLPQPGDALS